MCATISLDDYFKKSLYEISNFSSDKLDYHMALVFGCALKQKILAMPNIV